MKTRLLSMLLLCVCPAAWAAVQAQERFADRYNVAHITMADGLPHNHIDDMCKDSHGFMWISTAGGGVSRYDGYEFINFSTNTPQRRLKSNFVWSICEDNYRRLWIVSEEGTEILDLATLQIIPPDDPRGLLAGLTSRPAFTVMCDRQGALWLQCVGELHRVTFDRNGAVATLATLALPEMDNPDIMMEDIDGDGKIWAGIGRTVHKISPDSGGELRSAPVSGSLTFAPNTYCRDMIAKDNEVWFATDLGLVRYNRNSETVKRYVTVEGDQRSISQNYVTHLAVTADRQLIVGTLLGANIYNPITDDFERLTIGEATEGGLNSNFINCIAVEGNRIWFGTESGGLNRFTPKRLALRNYRHDRERPSSLSENPVNAIYEDDAGNLWVGTVEGGLNLKKRGSDGFIHYTARRGELSHNSVSSIAADGEGRMWVGTWGGGINIIDPWSPGPPLRVIDAHQDTGFPIHYVSVLIYDGLNRGMWIGTTRGLFFHDSATGRLVTPFPGAENARGCLGAVIDRENRLWIGSSEGVYSIELSDRMPGDPAGEFTHRRLGRKLDDQMSGPTEKITCLWEASDGTLWLGSNGFGIYKRVVDERGVETFVSYNSSHGLINDNVRSILEDRGGNLWIGTNNGLSRFSPTTERFTGYTPQDGLPDAQFYWNAALRSADGTLWFGSVAALTAIDREFHSLPSQPAGVRFTRLRIGNEDVAPGSRYLPEDITVTREIRFHQREKSFSVEFSALDFEQVGGAVYSYRLLGFEEQWIETPSDQRFAGYTNLHPGTYTLQVRYSADGEGGPVSTSALRVVVMPHFYRTTWFVALMVALAALMLLAIFRWRIKYLKRQHAEELAQEKISFFTGITHEFRTPITLIIGPIERALRLSHNPQVIEQLHFVERNSKYLLSLVNHLMDFRKVEAERLEIVKTRGDFGNFIRAVVTPFEVYAVERSITIDLNIRMPEPEISFDEAAMNKVISNLLSNAIKFTPDGGVVSIHIATTRGRLYICVSDTGTGIAKADIDRIFDRFYQAGGQTRYPMYGQTGTGIGLYVCKRIVLLMGGEIHVRNNRGPGCSFRVLIPLTAEEKKSEQRSIERTTTTEEKTMAPAVDGEGREREGTSTVILVVEDNADMRAYIRSILRDRYTVLEATDGAQALEILGAEHVDFIISDLMMPVMDGLELSRRVKETFPISHIPFLMLTAKSSQETRLESYRTGVDEYLLKPFDEALLVTRVENILGNIRRYQRRFGTTMDADALNLAEPTDKAFINRVMEVIKNNYKDPDFEVGDFCEAIGVSKSLLNKKLQGLLGQSAGQFIRNYRLNTAREMIVANRETRQMYIAEIAYEVGFNDPKYFARCFSRQFNIKPSELMK